MNSSRKILFTFLISFSLIMLVPFLLFSNIVFKQISKNELRNIASTYITATDNIGLDMLDLIESFSDLKSIMYKEDCFYNFNIEKNAGMYVYIERELKKIFTQKHSGVYFYSKTTDRFYGIVTYLKSSYFEKIGISTDQTESKFEASLLTNIPIWIPMYKANIDGHSGYFASYIVPFESEYEGKNPETLSSVIFNVSDTAFNNIFEPVTIKKDTFVILKADKIPIYSNSPELLEYFSHSSGENLKVVDNYETCTINDKKYLIFRSTVNNNNLEVITLVLYKSVQENLNEILGIFFFITLISLTIGCILIAIFTKYNYTPIYKLNKAILTSNVQLSNTDNFFDGITSAFQNLVIEKNQINSANIKYEKEKMLLKLISISYESIDSTSVLDGCRQIGINFRYACFICFILEFDNLPDYNINCENIAGKSDVDHDLYSYSYRENKSIIFLAAMEESNYKAIDTIITRIISNLLSPQDLPSAIGIGNFKTDITLFSNSYFEALQALNACESHNSNMLFFKDISNFNNDINVMLVLKEIENLYNSIINIDKDKILICYNTITNSLINSNNIHGCTMLCLQLVYKCEQACEYINADVSASLSTYIAQLSNQSFASIQEPVHIIKDVMDIVFSKINAQENNHSFIKISSQQKSIDINMIIKDINDRYLEPDFSVKNLASKFNTSVSNISHLFKNKTEINISDYINTLKINTVKKMLVETDLSISEISEHVGYYHTSNFIKKFKRIEGLTPNEYRNRNVK